MFFHCHRNRQTWTLNNTMGINWTDAAVKDNLRQSGLNYTAVFPESYVIDGQTLSSSYWFYSWKYTILSWSDLGLSDVQWTVYKIDIWTLLSHHLIDINYFITLNSVFLSAKNRICVSLFEEYSFKQTNNWYGKLLTGF